MTAIGRPLNYYGSKEKLAPRIHALIPSGPNTWVDLFCGSAIVTLAKPRHRREVINDLDGDVVNLFEVLRSAVEAERLCGLIELTPFSEELLYQVYDQPHSEDRVERAWQYLVKSWFGRGGDSHRTGLRWSKGATVAPEIIWARLPKRLVCVAERLARAKAQVILTMNPGTLYSEVLDGWNETRVEVQGGGNAIKSELILTNFVAPAPMLFDGAAQ